jgi:hypothetical protein
MVVTPSPLESPREVDHRGSAERIREIPLERLKEPLAVGEPKLAFTVKLAPSLIQRVRLYASVKNLSISEVVSRALLAVLPRGRGRG